MDEFWSSDFARRVKHPAPLKILLTAAEASPSLLYELTFYGRFAHNLFAVMRREGAETQGFERMQQSFTEAVGHVRGALGRLSAQGITTADRYLRLEQEAMTSLMDLIHDLGLVKEWQVATSGDPE